MPRDRAFFPRFCRARQSVQQAATASIALLLACAPSSPAPAPQTAGPASTQHVASASTSTAEVLPWLDNDYARALALARKRDALLFVDVWATWCHTCLSMRSFVFGDPGAATLRDRMVWLALDADLAKNADVVAKIPAAGLPTFFVIDPKNEQVVARWVGAMSLNELRAFVDDSEQGWRLSQSTNSAQPWLVALQRGDSAALAQRHRQAAQEYREALRLAPPAWPRRPSVLTAQIAAWSEADDPYACVDLALAQGNAMAHVSSTTDFLFHAASCAAKLEAADPRHLPLLQLIRQNLSTMLANQRAPLSADDRSDAFRLLWSTQEKLGDVEGAQQSARDRLALLNQAAAQAPSALAASTYDGARLETLLYLKRPAEAVAILQASAQALPSDYNPLARLARAQSEAGDLAAAQATIDRALAMAYGPRKVVLFDSKAEILTKSGQWQQAELTLIEAREFYLTLPLTQQKANLREHIEKRLASVKSHGQPSAAR